MLTVYFVRLRSIDRCSCRLTALRADRLAFLLSGHPERALTPARSCVAPPYRARPGAPRRTGARCPAGSRRSRRASARIGRKQLAASRRTRTNGLRLPAQLGKRLPVVESTLLVAVVVPVPRGVTEASSRTHPWQRYRAASGSASWLAPLGAGWSSDTMTATLCRPRSASQPPARVGRRDRRPLPEAGPAVDAHRHRPADNHAAARQRPTGGARCRHASGSGRMASRRRWAWRAASVTISKAVPPRRLVVASSCRTARSSATARRSA